MAKKKLILRIFLIIIVFAVGVFVIRLAFLFALTKFRERAMSQELAAEEISVESVKTEGSEVIVNYNQSINFEEKEELLSIWTYILAVATDNNPGAERIVVNCEFEDGQKVTLTAGAADVSSFLDKQISALQFLQRIKAEPVSQGPEM